MTTRKPWTRDELLLILNIYEKLDFGKFHASNPVIKAFAERMGRTPASVSMKLGNLGSLDHRLQARGVKGLTGASKLDREFWSAYQQTPDSYLLASEQRINEFFATQNPVSVDISNEGISISPLPQETEATRMTKTRLGQQFFRQSVMNAYNDTCALTGLSIREMLIASHIVPWSNSEHLRMDVRNGIALNSLHDKAFDIGLITFDLELRMVCAPTVSEHFTNAFASKNFKALEGRQLSIEQAHLSPAPKYLEYHREAVFRD